MRKATPDSEAVASSEDERPWPTAPSFGMLPRKENGVPGIGGGIWSNQKRGSFKMEKAGQRSVARDARITTVSQSHSNLRPNSTPSPAASDGSGVLPFAIPLQPTPKAGRSLSHSQGQRIISDQSMLMPLGLLTEEVDTETDSELGGGLTHTKSHPPIGTLQRTATLPPTFGAFYGVGSPRDTAASSGSSPDQPKAERKLEAAFATLSMDPSQRKAQWQSHLGWADVPNVNESRRHSLADIPTRRGSSAGTDGRPSFGGSSYWPTSLIYNWQEEESNPRSSQSQLDYGTSVADLDDSNEPTSRAEVVGKIPYNDNDDQARNEIPSMYRVPYIRIAEHERSEQDQRVPAPFSNAGQFAGGGSGNRPRKQLYIVSFKCSRVDVFYLLDNTGLFIKEGDIVIVEADRGQDLGTVQHANVTPEDARLYKRKYGEEQYKWLMMFSKNNQQGSVNPNAQLYGQNASAGSSSLIANASATLQGPSRDNLNLKPKAIKRLASGHEIRMLSEKEGNEAKAKRTCQQKVTHLHLDMEILDAEWQWDFQKLIFYYYADHYINFKDLITELYRIYKTRIWLSAINPASFSQHALGQPPSGIGPGAVGSFNGGLNNNYTMAYGSDPDPYGAVPPYRIGYDTYTPNYPGIPGVANSFAPPPSSAYGTYGGTSGDATPTLPPGVTPTGTTADYGYYYDRSGNEELTPRPFPAVPPVSASGTPAGYYGSMYPGAGMPPSGAAPSMSADRGAFGFGYAPPFNAATGMTANPLAFGRQGNAPPPIGTRASPTGNNPPPQVLMAATNAVPGRRIFPGRIAPDFVPAMGTQAPAGEPSFFGGGRGTQGWPAADPTGGFGTPPNRNRAGGGSNAPPAEGEPNQQTGRGHFGEGHGSGNDK